MLVEIQGAEAHALGDALAKLPGEHALRMRVDRGDGFERLKAFLPPPERRGLTLIDPPYEDGRDDVAQVGASAARRSALRRFPTGVHAAWFPIKQQRSAAVFVEQCAAQLAVPVLVSELWLYPRDARLALNGSGLLIVNAPGRRSSACRYGCRSCRNASPRAKAQATWRACWGRLPNSQRDLLLASSLSDLRVLHIPVVELTY